MRSFRHFQWKDADYRIFGRDFSNIEKAIKTQRRLLEKYIEKHRAFKEALEPIEIRSNAPEIARRMALASELCGTGPMAAVAGAMAQVAVEKSLEQGHEALVENGGDIYAALKQAVVIALYPGKDHPLTGSLALRIEPHDMPLALCSSSSKMGHSLSFGQCDLATVMAVDGALADAAATMACNKVSCEADVDKALGWLEMIPGLRGAIIVKNNKIGLWGDLPSLIKHSDANFRDKVTRHQLAYFE
ncbi:MAG: UPF0280 family protein [Spirochaetales bacterium]|nr:UPF0280 family protein [Spirochaetales bacterium]